MRMGEGQGEERWGETVACKAKLMGWCLHRGLSGTVLRMAAESISSLFPSVFSFGAHAHPRFFIIHIPSLTNSFRGGYHP